MTLVALLLFVVQPIPFSHRQHAAAKLECSDCHTMPGTGERAGLPATGVCMSCHSIVKKDAPAIRRLAEYFVKNDAVAWVRVYRLPDFVFFSHAKHAKAKVDCSDCHGPVHKRVVLTAEKPATKMSFCVDCHKSKKASIECNLCHELK